MAITSDIDRLPDPNLRKPPHDMTCTDQNKQIEDSIEAMQAPEAGVQAVSNLQMRMFKKAVQILKTGRIKNKKAA